MSIFQNPTGNSALGASDLSVYVSEPLLQYVNLVSDKIDSAISNALDKIVTEGGDIIYEPKPLNEISQNFLNTGPINMNGKRIENLDTSIDLSAGISGLLSTACSIGTASLLFPLTGIPLTTTASCNNKILTNVGTPYIYSDQDPPSTIDQSINSAVNFSLINQVCLTTSPYDRSNFRCNGKKIKELGDAYIYKENDVEPPLEDPNDNSAQLQYEGQAVNMKTAQDLAICLDLQNRTVFDAKQKKIINGKPARSVGDFVTLEQAVARLEDSKLEYSYLVDPDNITQPTDAEMRWADTREQLMIFSRNPVEPVNEKFDITEIVEEEKVQPQIEGLQQNLQQQTVQVDRGYQVANVNYVDSKTGYKTKKLTWTELTIEKKAEQLDLRDKILRIKTVTPHLDYFFEDNTLNTVSYQQQPASVEWTLQKCRLKGQDINLEEQTKITGVMTPTQNDWAVPKSYCDYNSGKTGDGGGNFFSTLFGAIAGAIAGAITSLVTQNITNVIGTAVGQGLSAIGSFAQNGLFQSGMRTGGVPDLEKMKDSASNGLDQLIDNELDDIANGGSASGDQNAGASIFSGPVGFDSLVRLARNAQIGLFDLVA